jgi:hypothetical protein
VKGQRNEEYRVFLSFFLIGSNQGLFFSFLFSLEKRRRSIKEADGDEIRLHENNMHLMERRVGWSNRVFLLAASKQGLFPFFSFFNEEQEEEHRQGWCRRNPRRKK